VSKTHNRSASVKSTNVQYQFRPTVSRLGSPSRAQIYHETNHYPPSRSRRGPQMLRFTGSSDSSLHDYMFLTTASLIFSGVIGFYIMTTIFMVYRISRAPPIYSVQLMSHADRTDSEEPSCCNLRESANPFPGPCESEYISDWNFSSGHINDLSVPSGSSLFCLCILLFADYWFRVVAVCYGLHASCLGGSRSIRRDMLGLHTIMRRQVVK